MSIRMHLRRTEQNNRPQMGKREGGEADDKGTKRKGGHKEEEEDDKIIRRREGRGWLG